MVKSIVLFLFVTILLVPAFVVPSYAACIEDEDWPKKPCLDTPPYTQQEVQEAWAPYYDYKGTEWMEMKKAQMEQAADNGTLMQWRQQQAANENVYQYYKAFGQQPTTIDDPGFRDDVIVTYWYTRPIAIAAMAAVAGAGTIAALIVVSKSRGKSSK